MLRILLRSARCKSALLSRCTTTFAVAINHRPLHRADDSRPRSVLMDVSLVADSVLAQPNGSQTLSYCRIKTKGRLKTR